MQRSASVHWWTVLIVAELGLAVALMAGQSGQIAEQSGQLASAKPAQSAARQLPANPGFEQGVIGQGPTGWSIPKVTGYQITVSAQEAAEGTQCATISATGDSPRSPFGNLMQSVDAKQFRGKRVRLTAAIRAEVAGKGNQAQMWFRVDRRDQEGNRRVGAFENMFLRPITSDKWDRYQIVGDVDNDAEQIAIGVFLAGDGQAWIDDVSLEVVGEDVAVTAGKRGERGATSLEDTQPGLFEIVGAFRLEPSTLALTSFRAIADSLSGAPIPPQTILVPLPLSYRDQVPLGFQLTVDPPDALKSIDIHQDQGDNWVLKLIVDDVGKWQQVDVSYSSAVLVGPSRFDNVPETTALPEAWPEEAKPWLEATWCADSKHERFQDLAAEIRAKTSDVREIIRHVESKAGQIFRSAEGQVWNLTAVEALDKRGSCTSSANLVAALLRATGVPARVLAGYPSWSGPLQTHYIVEAYVPGYGWYPIEATFSQSPWPNTQQVNVAIIPPEYETQEKASMRYGVAGGVPYLSLTEMPGSTGLVLGRGMVDSERRCDHECRVVRALLGSSAEWQQTLAWATARWQKWLQTNHQISNGQLSFGKKSEKIGATSTSELQAELK